MDLPRFLLGDNSDFPEATFIIHTEFPRFVMNLENGEVEWMEVFDQQDQKELEMEAESLMQQAYNFYDREIERYED